MEENKVETSAPGSGQPSVDSKPMPEENVRPPFEDDKNDVDSKPIPELDAAEPELEPSQNTSNPEKGVQLVHVTDENPEDHVGAETADPWDNNDEDWKTQPSDKSSE